ncbi:MAG: hypothetical protein HYV02_07250 [Deltaproteobacteria bacterium]|nr:hypothetical protein [Deltaproteobacteria bacterium]
MAGIGVILNPHSRSNRHNPERIRRLAFIVGDKGSCHATQDVFDVRTIAEGFAQRAIDVLCISGGDGTIHHTLTAVINVYGSRPLPKIALLRGGTVNNVAGCLKIRGTPESILSQLILQYHSDEPLRTIPLHCIAVEQRYGFLFGNGFVYNFIQDYISVGEGGTKNLLPLVVRMCCSGLFNREYMLQLNLRFDAEVIVDGKRWPFRNYSGIGIATVETCGMGFAPFFLARKETGQCHVVGYSMTPRGVFLEAMRVWLKQIRPHADRCDATAREVVIRTRDPLPYTIDGELYPPTDALVIRCGPVLQIVHTQVP